MANNNSILCSNSDLPVYEPSKTFFPRFGGYINCHEYTTKLFYMIHHQFSISDIDEYLSTGDNWKEVNIPNNITYIPLHFAIISYNSIFIPRHVTDDINDGNNEKDNEYLVAKTRLKKYLRALVMILLKFGANMMNPIDYRRRHYDVETRIKETPWMLACQTDRPDLFELFLDNGLLDQIDDNRRLICESEYYTLEYDTPLYTFFYDGTIDPKTLSPSDVGILGIMRNDHRKIGLIEYCIRNNAKKMVDYLLSNSQYEQLMPYFVDDPYLSIRHNIISKKMIQTLINHRIYPNKDSIAHILKCFEYANAECTDVEEQLEVYQPDILKLMLQYSTSHNVDLRSIYSYCFAVDSSEYIAIIKECYQSLLIYGYRVTELETTECFDIRFLKSIHAYDFYVQLKQLTDETKKQHTLVLQEFMQDGNHYIYRPSSIATRCIFLKYQLIDNNPIINDHHQDLLRYLSLDLNVSPKELLERLLSL
jgi:hypothetical protein